MMTTVDELQTALSLCGVFARVQPSATGAVATVVLSDSEMRRLAVAIKCAMMDNVKMKNTLSAVYELVADGVDE